MPAGIPGRVSRRGGVALEPVQLGAAMLFGAPGKIVGGKLVPLAAGDTPAAIYGFLASPFPTQSDMADLGGGSAPAETIQSVMRSGYMTVKIPGGTAAKNAPVHLITPGAAAGSIAVTGGTAIPGCEFQGAADASGNVEISYNVGR